MGLFEGAGWENILKDMGYDYGDSSIFGPKPRFLERREIVNQCQRVVFNPDVLQGHQCPNLATDVVVSRADRIEIQVCGICCYELDDQEYKKP